MIFNVVKTASSNFPSGKRFIASEMTLLLFIFIFYTGKFAFFKAIVIGDPTPTVTWTRNNGDVSDTTRYQTRYNDVDNEHLFEVSDKVQVQSVTHQ